MQTSARSLDEVYDCLKLALDELDIHGQAMAALHLAMAVDCLKDSITGTASDEQWQQADHPRLRLVASS
ncbi:hypothetical protein IP81_11800 [Novosphingobium sp. AAP83]|uniref:hypothetical protein n=1 Tax=Novosphingobium sp. AAP83 TaxID=1523425 RepID=UPI0006B93BC7|nr:hypothetical protein [Novosphingobium sp. AAP83]KPF90924.1 hypothetical protein IP81_11800 [Novosphingobium sp. AAP83]